MEQVNIAECIKNKTMSHAKMNKYDCHKQVHALPMNRGAYNKVKGWDIPKDENPNDNGYLVVYNRGSDDEYVSWSPKHIFEDGYTVTVVLDGNDVNNFELKLTTLINQENNIPLVTVYGVLKLIAADLLNKASMARIMLSEGKNNEQ
jgi:hypothetical protein